MNLFKNKKNNLSSHGHSPLKHMFHMLLCCGLPILIIMSLPVVAGFSPIIASFLGLIAPLICPLMMGGMLFMMFRKNKNSCCEVDDKNKVSDSITNK
ncbi:MAG: uncharacterized protein K0S47_1813 [Herbinix sp.]|nr:uncharacterized protein [Herbinix sp.]